MMKKKDVQSLLRNIQTAFAETTGLTDDAALISGPTYRFPGLGCYSMCLPDLMLDQNDAWRATEVNTSNGAGTSSHGGDLPRVFHEMATIRGRHRPLDGAVILRPFSPDTRSTPEILTRAAALATLLSPVISRTVSVTSVNSGLPSGKAPVVVVGDIPTMAAHLQLDGSELKFKGRPVAFMNNANLLAELARLETRPLMGILSDLDPGVLHEGTAVAAIGFDKVYQQELAEGTGLTPISAQRCSNANEAIIVARNLAARFGGAMIKPDAASGGTGVVPVDPSASDTDIASDLDAALMNMSKKYGPRWRETCPLAAYEFAHAKPVPGPDGHRRWDLRFEVLVSPEKTLITPLSARLCPAPIGSRITRADAVCNQTGRSREEAQGMEPRELCRRIGITDAHLGDAARAAYGWIQRALSHGSDSVQRHDCVRED